MASYLRVLVEGLVSAPGTVTAFGCPMKRSGNTWKKMKKLEHKDKMRLWSTKRSDTY